MDPAPDDALTALASPRLARGSVLAVAFVTLLGTVGSALSPWLLLQWPLSLIALSPDVRHLVLVAGQADFVPVLLVGLPRRAAGLFAMYGLGFFYGPSTLAWFRERAPRLGGVLTWLEHQFARFGAPLLLVFPSYTMGALAGAARCSLRSFVPAMLLGQVLYITAAYFFGDAIRDWTRPLLAFLGQHLVASTLVCVGLVALQQLWSRRPRREQESGPTGPTGR